MASRGRPSLADTSYPESATYAETTYAETYDEGSYASSSEGGGSAMLSRRAPSIQSAMSRRRFEDYSVTEPSISKCFSYALLAHYIALYTIDALTLFWTHTRRRLRDHCSLLQAMSARNDASNLVRWRCERFASTKSLPTCSCANFPLLDSSVRSPTTLSHHTSTESTARVCAGRARPSWRCKRLQRHFSCISSKTRKCPAVPTQSLISSARQLTNKHPLP